MKTDGIEVTGKGLNGGGTVRFQHVFRALQAPSSSPTNPSSLSSSPETVPAFSYIIVTTKLLATITPSTVECLEPYVVSGKTTIVLIQNGVGIEDEIQARWPDNLVLTCIVRSIYSVPAIHTY